MEELTLAPAGGVAVHGLAGAASVSLFLLTKVVWICTFL